MRAPYPQPITFAKGPNATQRWPSDSGSIHCPHPHRCWATGTVWPPPPPLAAPQPPVALSALPQSAAPAQLSSSANEAALVWATDSCYTQDLCCWTQGLSERTLTSGAGASEAARERLRKLVETTGFVLRRTGLAEGCLAVGVLSAALRRAAAKPLEPCWLSADELRSVVSLSGGEMLLEDCGFRRYQAGFPAPVVTCASVASSAPAATSAPVATSALGNIAAPVPTAAPAAKMVDESAVAAEMNPTDAGSPADTGRSRRKVNPNLNQESRVMKKKTKLPKPDGLSPLEERLWVAFELVDRDNSGGLSRREFTQAIINVGIARDECDARAEWAAVDVDQSGVIGWDEFKQLAPRLRSTSSSPAKVDGESPTLTSSASRSSSLSPAKTEGGWPTPPGPAAASVPTPDVSAVTGADPAASAEHATPVSSSFALPTPLVADSPDTWLRPATASAEQLALLRATSEFVERCLDGGWQWADPLQRLGAPPPPAACSPGWVSSAPTALEPSHQAVYERAYSVGRDDGCGKGSLQSWHGGYARGHVEGWSQGQTDGYEHGWAAAREQAAEAQAADPAEVKHATEKRSVQWAVREAELHAIHTRELTEAKSKAADELHSTHEELKAARAEAHAANERMKFELEMQKRAQFEDGVKHAKQQGLEQGYAQGCSDGHVQGRSDGYVQGRSEGYSQGKYEGYAEGLAAKDPLYAEGLAAKDVELSTLKAEMQQLRAALEAARSSADAAQTEVIALKAGRDRLGFELAAQLELAAQCKGELAAQASFNAQLQQSLGEAYHNGHNDGVCDERAASEGEARRLEATPRYARNSLVGVEAPRQPLVQPPWRPAGRHAVTPAERAAARSPPRASPATPEYGPRHAPKWPTATRTEHPRSVAGHDHAAEVLLRTAYDLASHRV